MVSSIISFMLNKHNNDSEFLIIWKMTPNLPPVFPKPVRIYKYTSAISTPIK